MRLPEVWGATADEVAREYPCDRFADGPHEEWYRAVTADAPPGAVYRWLCQLRVAPYSYDLLDNFGRRSPRALTPGLDRLETGQRVMGIFELIDFEPGEHLTLRLASRSGKRIFGSLVISYTVRPCGDGRSRLVVKMITHQTYCVAFSPWRAALAWGDLVMMRKQLHTLGRLAAGH